MLSSKHLELFLKSLPYLVIIFLLIMLETMRCNNKPPVNPEPPDPENPRVVIKRDTQWIVKRDTVYGKPKLQKSEVDTLWMVYFDTIPYLTPEIIFALQQHFTRNIYADTLKIDSLGYAYLKDTTFRNLITGRSFHYDLTIPKIKETVEVPVNKRELYLGTTLIGNQKNPLTGVYTGLMYKDLKGKMMGVSIGYTGTLHIGASMYVRLRFK